jgi:AcrR family transcriptional regulator
MVDDRPVSERAAEAPAAAEPKGPCDRREEILVAATCLFAEHGYADTDTQRLADKLGVGKGTLYRNFPSKRELFLAAVDRAMRQLHDRIQARIDGVEDPFERVSRAVEAYLDFFDGHPEHVELLIQERAQFKDRSRPTYFIHREKSLARWRSMYRSLIEEGRVRPMPVERITDVISAALYGSMFLNYFAGRTETFAATADDILDVVFFGILSDEERRRRLEGRDEHGNEHEGP